MLSFEQMIQAVDSHTAGEPTRVVTGGLPQIAGATMTTSAAPWCWSRAATTR